MPKSSVRRTPAMFRTATTTPFILAALLLVLSCGGNAPGAAQETQAATTTEKVTAGGVANTPTGLNAIKKAEVSWARATSPMTPALGKESEDPFGALRESQIRAGDSKAGPNDWAVYIAGQDHSPTRLYSTHRKIEPGSFGWDDHDISMAFATQLEVPVLGEAERVLWGGELSIDPESRKVTEHFEKLPWEFGSPRLQQTDGMSWSAIGHDKILFLLNRRASIAAISPYPNGLYMIDSSGRASRLTGVPGITFAIPVNEGRAILAAAGPRIEGEVPPILYVIPTDGSLALEIRNARYYVTEPTTASVNRGRHVLLQLESSPTECCEIVLINTETLEARSVTRLALGSKQRLTWKPADGGLPNGLKGTVVVGENELNLNTGVLQALSPQPQSPIETGVTRLTSPNSSTVAVITQRSDGSVSDPCIGIEFEGAAKITVANGDCIKGYLTSAKWWDSDQLAISLAVDASGALHMKYLADPKTGLLQAIVPWHPFAIVSATSPDKSRILVGGPSLTIYANSGEHLWTFNIDEDLSVWAVAWSKDGSRFAFLTGPTNCSVCAR